MKNVLASSKPSIWLQLYFVLASLLGLIMISIGLSSFVNNILMSTVLKIESSQMSIPPQPYLDTKAITTQEGLTEEQKQALANWEKDYQRWQETEKTRDYESENRRRELAWAIALLISGAPIFALHAPFVFRQMKA